MNNMIFDNEVIIVTGGNGLLGKELIADLKRKGALAINADINVETDIQKGSISCDITSLSSIKETIDTVVKAFGKLDGLVNNAYPRTKDWGTDFLEITDESLKNNVNWQMNSYMLFCQQAIKQMLSQKRGSIVNIASIYGLVGNDFTLYENTGVKTAAPYAAIKGGLINFTRYLASRFGQDGIRINTVSPGGIFDGQDQDFVKAYEKKVPVKRMASPSDIAPAVSFLLSDEAKYITGHNLVVDGGWTAI